MFTSGYLLEQYAADLKKAGLTSVIVSLNATNAAEHDAIKKKPGTFDSAIRGIKAARKAGLLVGIASVVYKKHLGTDHIQNIIEMGKSLKANQIIFFDSIPAGAHLEDTEVIWNDQDVDRLIEICHEYHSKPNYPGVLAYSYINSYRSIGCYAGTIYFYVSPYGDVCPCDFCSFSVGNVLEEPVHVLWDRFSDHKEFQRSSLSGCKMKDSAFRKKFAGVQE